MAIKLNRFILQKKINFWLLILNIALLGIGPVIILILLAIKSGSFPITPWWANGLFIAWAMTINLWMGLGFLFTEEYTPVYSRFFIITNLFLPLGISLALRGSFWLTLYEITSFHFLSLALAITILMWVGPFLKFKGIKNLPTAIGWLIFGGLVFGYFLTLPAIWCEMFLWQELNKIPQTTFILWLAIRYWSVILNTTVLLRLLFLGSIYR